MNVYIIAHYTGPYMNEISLVFESIEDATAHLVGLQDFYPRSVFRILERKVTPVSLNRDI